MHFSCTFRHCPSEHLLSISSFPLPISLFVTYLFSNKIMQKYLFVKICFTSYIIMIRGQMGPLKKLHLVGCLLMVGNRSTNV